jgi:hypothetical protein
MTTTAHARPAMTKSTRLAWFQASLQLVCVFWFGVCVWVALARAAHFAGHWYIPYDGDPYTASVDIWAGWSRGFEAPMMATVVLEPGVALVLIGVSAWLLAQKRTRNNIILFSVLLISTLLVVACFVLRIVPAGRSISDWILD